eukprot:CAMPEP_0184367898 /NCGR_PEP_ID=MMETSP1089-20130417/160314_1 /TAXON_ID=38269 ORGANISM="Gloeochaete wittrockiana, Strain SAG46.84" /NCGR_SAMPLE_ID=MMETSP1089 /ASSEMBLY_ACC=CAM_ASM_000445 /LENGTH=37 /DNA_ID= /DNA_START= /DNA_END= /DNA_ORIENTATION=
MKGRGCGLDGGVGLVFCTGKGIEIGDHHDIVVLVNVR